MSRTGNCCDNAPMKSFFGTLKTELIHHRQYATRAEVKPTFLNILRCFTIASGVIQPGAIKVRSSMEPCWIGLSQSRLLELWPGVKAPN
jgi:hypothetical protein